MSIDGTTLAAELIRLRKGPAMLDPKLVKRLGPQTRLAFDLAESDPVPMVRRKVRARVVQLLTDDHDHHRTAALAALALSGEADQRLLAQRQTWLAMHLTCDARTARRRMDAAFDRLVDALVELDHARDLPRAPSYDGYSVQRLRATMRLDTPRPELHEYRTIQVTADRLDAIIVRMTVPRSEPAVECTNLEVTAVRGGRITKQERRSPEHFEIGLELPQPLRLGAVHEYGLIFTIPAGQPMRPHYVFQPLVPCEAFELTVCFDPARTPEDIWLIDGVAPRLLDDTGKDAPRLRPDAGVRGRVRVRCGFTDLRMGLAYGVRWSPLDSPAVRQ